MLEKESVMVVMVDVQGNLAQAMYKKDKLFDNLRILLQGVRLFGLPVIWMEQTPDKLGPTIPELAELLPDLEPISKRSFSCCGEPRFLERLKAVDRPMVLLCGIETHVCIYQTAVDLQQRGYQVEVVVDAVSSRTKLNKKIGLEKIVAAGAGLTSVETALFELQRGVDDGTFRQLVKLVK
ncbi:MAG: hydrolase [Candidatus Neomarinimicrobiota bacterium]